MQVIRILHCSGFPFSSGGIDTWLYGFVKRNPEILFEVYRTTPNCLQNETFDLKGVDNIRFVDLPEVKGVMAYLYWAFRVALIINKNTKSQERVTLLVLSTIPAMIPIAFLRGLRRNLNVICSNRGVLYQDISMKMGRVIGWLYKQIDRFLLSLANVVVSNGLDTSEILKDEYGISSVCAPNCVDWDRLRSNAPVFDVPSNYTVVGVVSTFRAIKGVRELEEMIDSLSSEAASKLFFIFVGKGDTEKLKSICERKAIGFVFLGEVADVAPYIKACDFTLHLSGGSGVSHSLLESLGLGVPVLAWDRLTYSQVVNPTNGIMVKSGCVPSLREAVENLPSLKGEFAEDIVKASVSHFDYSEVDEIYVRLSAANE